jgi:hypothetical protein
MLAVLFIVLHVPCFASWYIWWSFYHWLDVAIVIMLKLSLYIFFDIPFVSNLSDLRIRLWKLCSGNCGLYRFPWVQRRCFTTTRNNTYSHDSSEYFNFKFLMAYRKLKFRKYRVGNISWIWYFRTFVLNVGNIFTYSCLYGMYKLPRIPDSY